MLWKKWVEYFYANASIFDKILVQPCDMACESHEFILLIFIKEKEKLQVEFMFPNTSSTWKVTLCSLKILIV